MEMIDHPRWQAGPVEFRVLICRLLLIQLAMSWAEEGQGAVRADHVEDHEHGYRKGKGYGSGGHAATGAAGSGIQ